MSIFSTFSDRIKSYRKSITEAGFNMLEIVIGVGLILILSAGGIVVYKNITTNAKTAAVESAASTIFNAAVAYELDGDITTDMDTAVEEYQVTQKDNGKITVSSASAPSLSITVTDKSVTPNITATRTAGFAAELP